MPIHARLPEGHGDDFRVLQEAVEDGRGGRDVADQFAPIFYGAVAGQYR